MVTQVDQVSEQLYRRVAARLTAYDDRLEPELADGLLYLVEPRSGTPVVLGLSSDGRANLKLYAAARVDRSVSRALGSSLGRLLGMVQVLRVEDGSEVRRWSPYRLEDIERTPQEADDWACSTLQAILEELHLRAKADAVEEAEARPFADSLPATFLPQVDDLIASAGDSRLSGVAELTDASEQPAIDTASVLAARNDAQLERDLAAASAELERLRALLDEVTAERDLAAEGLRDAETRASGVHHVVDPTPQLVSAFELVADGGARAGTCIAVLRQFLQVAPTDLRLRESLGIYLLRDDQVADAIKELSGLGPEGLTPRGASALAEASFRQRTMPDPLDVLARVDWRVGSVAQQLREVPRWAKRDQLLPVAQLVAESAPPEFEAFLSDVARAIGPEQLQPLFELWFDLDPAAALDQLVGWVSADRAQLSQRWVHDGVRLALSPDDRRTARTALDLLSEDAERRKDAADLVSLVEDARNLLRPADWRQFAIRWTRDAASITSDPQLLDRCAAVAADILRELSIVREDDSEYALASVLERRVGEPWAGNIRSELARLRPSTVTVTDVTTVSEALKATSERYPSLVVLPDAERSAAKRGTVGVKKAREALFALGGIAEGFAAGEFDQGLDEALGALPDFKPDISVSAKRQFRRQYLKTLSDGRKVMLGPHFDIGGEDGRAYLYVDKVGKRIVLGHCGDHLPGKRDT